MQAQRQLVVYTEHKLCCLASNTILCIMHYVQKKIICFRTAPRNISEFE